MKLRYITAVALSALMVGSAPPWRTRIWRRSKVSTDSADRLADRPADRRQGGAVKQILKKIKLPPGFHIELYALVPDARHMAVGPQGVVTFVGTRKSKIWVVTDRSRSGVGDEVKEFAPTLTKKLPNGPCFSKDGFLYVVEQNRVLQYPAAEFFYESPDVAVGVVVPEGQLIPNRKRASTTPPATAASGLTTSSTSSSASPTTCRRRTRSTSTRRGMGGIIRMDQDGKNREVYATGLRNPVGMDFNPKDKTLWSNDNQVDGMGDDIPPGEMNRIDKMGENFGFPWYGGGTRARTNTRTTRRRPTSCSRRSSRSRMRPTSA